MLQLCHAVTPMLAGRADWRRAAGGGGQLWRGRGGGKQQTNSFSFVLEGWLLQTPRCVQPGWALWESLGLRLLLPIGFWAFCALLGLGFVGWVMVKLYFQSETWAPFCCFRHCLI